MNMFNFEERHTWRNTLQCSGMIKILLLFSHGELPF
jgi:hypothetical protein